MPSLSAYRPAPRAASLTFALLAAAACGDATAPLPTNGPPREFTLVTSGTTRVTSAARVVGDTAVYVSHDLVTGDSTVLRRIPTAAERVFWQDVRDAGVARWPAACTDTHVADGGGFAYTLAWADARRAGTYTNSFPTRDGGCGASDDSMALFNAVYALVGLPVS